MIHKTLKVFSDLNRVLSITGPVKSPIPFALVLKKNLGSIFKHFQTPSSNSKASKSSVLQLFVVHIVPSVSSQKFHEDKSRHSEKK